jgi:hypothetical protein
LLNQPDLELQEMAAAEKMPPSIVIKQLLQGVLWLVRRLILYSQDRIVNAAENWSGKAALNYSRQLKYSAEQFGSNLSLDCLWQMA